MISSMNMISHLDTIVAHMDTSVTHLDISFVPPLIPVIKHKRSRPDCPTDRPIKKRKKYRRRKNDPLPKKPKTAYTFYQLATMETHWKVVTASHGNENRERQSRLVAQHTGQAWRQMTLEERQPYMLLAATDSRRYEQEKVQAVAAGLLETQRSSSNVFEPAQSHLSKDPWEKSGSSSEDDTLPEDSTPKTSTQFKYRPSTQFPQCRFSPNSSPNTSPNASPNTSPRSLQPSFQFPFMFETKFECKAGDSTSRHTSRLEQLLLLVAEEKEVFDQQHPALAVHDCPAVRTLTDMTIRT